MTDQGPSNKPFLRELENLRRDGLKKLHIWNTLDDEERKAEISKIHNFYCKMHLIVNMATEAANVLVKFEEYATASGQNPHTFIVQKVVVCDYFENPPRHLLPEAVTKVV